MIVYSETKKTFLEHVLTNDIENIILSAFKSKLGFSTSPNEIRSWKNSLANVAIVLTTPDIADDVSISIEYQIPQTSKRIDLIVSGQDESLNEVVLIIELKQWESAEATEKDAIVKTFVSGREREVSHPSYQAWSYVTLIEDFNTIVQNQSIKLLSCAYLHNYMNDGVINSPFYSEYIKSTPLFLKEDALKLRAFISDNVTSGDSNSVLKRIDSGTLSPSKNLADKLRSLLEGNNEFTLIDDQKVVYEEAKDLVAKSKVQQVKRVLIVEGGPGTGKSVVAINLLVDCISQSLNARYVTKNAAPRSVYESKLTGLFSKSRISNLFTGSGGFTATESNEYDALIVDEAHRLNEKSGLYQNLGDNQVKEIVKSAYCSIFFIDEDQKVTIKDIGTKDEIKKWATFFGAEIVEVKLESQFRCNGSDGYIAWLDNTLQIHSTANTSLDGIDYDFKVFDTPNALSDKTIEMNSVSKARIVAGYCWPWLSKKDKTATDINIPDFGFGMKWNLTEDGGLWILKESSINEVGCIHTCQGLELDYISVIIGPDLIVRDGVVITVPEARAKNDSSIKGYKKMLLEDPEKTISLVDQIIKNTYRTLMTRGSKGCYIFCTDDETRDYFQGRL